MTSITSKNVLFANLFGEQNISDQKLKLASYCATALCEEGVLLFNSLSQELVLLTNEEYSSVENINRADGSLAKYLKKSWFYIPETANAKDYCNQMLNAARMMRSPRKEHNYRKFVITTTLECNARCFYCFQAGRVQPRMSPKTAEDVVKFILSHTTQGETINIEWYGGEPLCNQEVIDIIANGLKNANINFESKMYTNGYMLYGDVIAKAKNVWNLKRVQITLDGTEAVYNRVKNYIYKDVESPFKTVIANIKNVLESGIFVAVRLNLGLYNSEDLYKLGGYLADELSVYSNATVYSHRLFDYNEFGKQLHKDAEIEDTINLFNDFNCFLFDKKITRAKPLPVEYKLNRCTGDSETGVVITPDGKLTKCHHFSDMEIFGDIYSEEFDKELLLEWKKLQPRQDICEDCAAYMYCYRLDKCPDLSPECTVYEKGEQINILKLRILSTYNRWKAKN